MILLHLVADTFIRYVYTCVPSTVSNVHAFVDDMNFVVGNIRYYLLVLFKAFKTFGRATGMWLNWRKCVLIPLGDIDIVLLRAWLRAKCPRLGDIAIQDHAKLLGVYVGPGAAGKSWPAVTAKVDARARSIRSYGLGLMKSTFLFNRDAMSVITYVAQFVTPSNKDVVRLDRSMHRVTAAPCYALPKGLLRRMKEV